MEYLTVIPLSLTTTFFFKFYFIFKLYIIVLVFNMYKLNQFSYLSEESVIFLEFFMDESL